MFNNAKKIFSGLIFFGWDFYDTTPFSEKKNLSVHVVACPILHIPFSHDNSPLHFSSSTVCPDSSLKDAAEIQWHFDKDKMTMPVASGSGPTPSSPPHSFLCLHGYSWPVLIILVMQVTHLIVVENRDIILIIVVIVKISSGT